jgi:hypothetical protein
MTKEEKKRPDQQWKKVLRMKNEESYRANNGRRRTG